jgi:hypothetical protein
MEKMDQKILYGRDIRSETALPLVLSDGEQLRAFASGREFHRTRPIILKLP